MANTVCAKCKREWQADAPDEECPFCALAKSDEEFMEGIVEACRKPSGIVLPTLRAEVEAMAKDYTKARGIVHQQFAKELRDSLARHPEAPREFWTREVPDEEGWYMVYDIGNRDTVPAEITEPASGEGPYVWPHGGNLVFSARCGRFLFGPRITFPPVPEDA